MIARGEVLERMTLVRAAADPAAPHAASIELEALFQDGASSVARALPVVFAAPHPRLGGNMDSPVLAELVWVLARSGHPTLRFNWRGVGASQGQTRVPFLPAAEPPPLDDEVADLRAAVDQQLAQMDARGCALVGYSFGAVVAAELARTHAAVERLVLIAPPLWMRPLDLTSIAADGTLVTLITGEADEHAPPAALRQAAGGAHVHVVAGATHTFLRGLSQLGAVVRESLPGSVD